MAWRYLQTINSFSGTGKNDGVTLVDHLMLNLMCTTKYINKHYFNAVRKVAFNDQEDVT